MFTTQTANGFVAHASGEMPWSESTHQDRYELAKRFPAVIVGRNTFEVLSEGDEFTKLGNPLVIVVTSTHGALDENTVFVETAKEAITELHGRDITQALLLGGAITNTKFLDAGLVSEVIMDLEPQLFSHGAGTFTKEAPSVQLELLHSEQRGANIRLHYKVLN